MGYGGLSCEVIYQLFRFQAGNVICFDMLDLRFGGTSRRPLLNEQVYLNTNLFCRPVLMLFKMVLLFLLFFLFRLVLFPRLHSVK